MHSLEQHLVPIDFLIIGGGVAGLCSAISLTQVGHRVTLFEQGLDFEKVVTSIGIVHPLADRHLSSSRHGVLRGVVYLPTCRSF